MKTNYILIDYENVQPADLSLLRDGSFKVKVFLGANQAKIPVALAAQMQALGDGAEYVVLSSSGSNALDFHIAYYIGHLSAHDQGAFFHVISNDTGFDPLIKHLKSKGVLALRSSTISTIPILAPAPSIRDQVQVAVAHLTKLKAARPRAKKTLESTLHSLFKKALSDSALVALVDALCKGGFVKVDGAKVSYGLPPVP